MIGSTLKELLAERRMAVRELAWRIGVPTQTLHSLIRRDNMKIDLEVLLRICEELEVPLNVFAPDPSHSGAGMDAPSLKEWAHLRRFRALDEHGRELTELVMERELARLAREREEREEETRVIPLFATPAAAGYASPALDEDYEDYVVPAASPAEFAVRIAGDSMEPLLHDGGVALVGRGPVENGDVGMFFVDGDMKCKQYLRDVLGNVYLFSLNRARADADVTIPASSGVTLCCFGKVLLERKPPLP